MRLLLLNPNTSEDMTKAMAGVARKAVPGTVEIAMATARLGPQVIATRAAFAIAGYGALDAFAPHAGLYDGVLLACFGDPGLAALREVAGLPVSGLLEASVKTAARRGLPFGIVTAGAAWKDMIKEQIVSMSEARLFVGVELIEGTGLDIHRNPDAALSAIADASLRLAARGAEVVILGGGAMAGLSNQLHLPVETIDCVRAGIDELVRTVSQEFTFERPGTVKTTGLSRALQQLLAPE